VAQYLGALLVLSSEARQVEAAALRVFLDGGRSTPLMKHASVNRRLFFLQFHIALLGFQASPPVDWNPEVDFKASR
jgi:hypothetical protein